MTLLDRLNTAVGLEIAARDCDAAHFCVNVCTCRDEGREAARATLAALEAEGWQVVPRVATAEMLAAAHNAPMVGVQSGTQIFRKVQRLNLQYHAAIAAAPKPEDAL